MESTAPATQPNPDYNPSAAKASVTVKQPIVNVMRSLLNQEGYAKDFGDFYAAGKALAEALPESKFVAPGDMAANAEILEMDVTFSLDPETIKIVKKALKHYIDGKKPPTEYHFALMLLLKVDPSKSL